MRAFTIWYTISLTVSLSSFPSGALCKTSRSVYCMSSNTMNTCGSLLFFLVVLVVFWEKLVSSLMMFGWPCRSLSRETSLSAILCAYYDKLRVKVIRLNKKDLFAKRSETAIKNPMARENTPGHLFEESHFCRSDWISNRRTYIWIIISELFDRYHLASGLLKSLQNNTVPTIKLHNQDAYPWAMS